MITVTFTCGHTRTATGAEERLSCPCGESRIASVDAPLPTFRGAVRGPHAEYVDLPAKPVTFEVPRE